MNKTIIYSLGIIVILAGIIGLHFLVDHPAGNIKNNLAGAAGTMYDNKYTVIPANSTVSVTSGPAVLEGIVFGSDTTSGSAAIWDSAAALPTNNTPVFSFNSSTLHGYYPMDIEMTGGILATTTSQLGTTIIWH